jgi:hypothetical protein
MNDYVHDSPEAAKRKRRLESYLDPSCSYFPSDAVDRGGNTIVLDLNSRPLPDLSYLELDLEVLLGSVSPFSICSQQQVRRVYALFSGDTKSVEPPKRVDSHPPKQIFVLSVLQ